MQLSKPTALYVAGAGGHGREVHSYIEDLRRGGWAGELRGYLDDGLPVGRHGRIDIIGPIDGHEALSGRYITALGANALRRQIVQRLAARYGDDLRPWTLIHPRAHLGEDIAIGDGTCLAPGAIVTTGVEIGCHCIVNVNASISHDCRISDFVNLNPGSIVCGNVTLGEGAYIGAGAVLKDGIFIGAWSIIGAGAVVVRNIPPNVTATGIPARVSGHH